jgi:hypothetical protein
MSQFVKKWSEKKPIWHKAYLFFLQVKDIEIAIIKNSYRDDLSVQKGDRQNNN